MYRRLFAEHQGLDKPEVDFVELPEVNKEVTDYDRVVNLVFVPDHRTALPSSDISVYLSAKTPPQVREFIKDNIFGEPKQPNNDWSSEIDDDLICSLVRQSDETVEEYSERVSLLMINERDRMNDSFVRLRNAERAKLSKSE